MPNYKPYDYNQSAMVVVNFEDQIQPGTFEHTVHHLIDNSLDLSIFDAIYKNDHGGRTAYDPAILLKIILFAYSKGITSSREIQWNCENNIIFKALSCDTVPHFTTIAAFVSSHSQAMEVLFEQVLLVCYQQNLLGNELFAIDGCKISSNAAKEWSGTHKELEEKRKKIKRQIRHCTKAHRELDQRETQQHERAQRLEQTRDTLNKAHEKIQQFLKTRSPRMGQGKRQKEVKSNITDNESAKMTTSKGTIQGYNGVATVDKKHQIIVDAQTFGEGQEHHTLKPVTEAVKERLKRLGIAKDIYKAGTVITADTGFANEANMQYLYEQGINGYIPDNKFRSRDPRFQQQKDKYGKRQQNPKKQQTVKVIPASEFNFNPANKTCICPAGETMWIRSEKDDEYGNPKIYFEGRLSKCRECSIKKQCMKNPDSPNDRKGHGRQVSFILNSKRKSNYTDWMKHRVDSDKGKEIYSHRMSVVEPVFANIGTNKRLNRFSLRSKKKVQTQWRLYCMVHNIEKIMNYGEAA